LGQASGIPGRCDILGKAVPSALGTEERLPTIGTGKLDMKRINQIALEAGKRRAASEPVRP
jgi:hypothetical protein